MYELLDSKSIKTYDISNGFHEFYGPVKNNTNQGKKATKIITHTKESCPTSVSIHINYGNFCLIGHFIILSKGKNSEKF